MEIIQKAIKKTGAEYYIKHLGIINPFLPLELTPKEREVLGTFMSLEGETAKRDRFGTSFRKDVKAALNLSDGGLGNHLGALQNKGAIYKELDGTLHIKDYLFPEEGEQKYQFRLINNGV